MSGIALATSGIGLSASKRGLASRHRISAGKRGGVFASHRAGRRSSLTLATVGVALSMLGVSHRGADGAVIVQQVEVGTAAGTPSYTPINFNGAPTATSSSYPGITFNAQLAPDSSTSDHARIVGDYFYGPNSYGAGAISQVYVHAAVTFDSSGNANIPGDLPFYYDAPIYNGIGELVDYRMSVLHMRYAANGPAPGPFAQDVDGNGVKVRVTNHSYVLDFGSPATNTEAVRRSDFLINRENVVWVGGCANGTQVTGGGTGRTTMAWQVRNGIAVRGNAPQSPFDPSLGSAGRQHADVWDGNLVSFSCGTVSGSAAALINLAGTNTAMGDARVIKSVIMTSADKTIHPGTFNLGGPAWQPTTANNLDGGAGAGKFDHNAAVAVLSAGQRAIATVTAPNLLTTSELPSTIASGWAFGSAAAAGERAVLIRVDKPLSTLSATLNWNVSSTGNASTIDVSDAALRFPDLNLSVRQVSWNGSQYVLGDVVANAAGRGFSSNATGLNNDNVEHVYQTSGVLSPGTYAFYFSNPSSITTNAALSYRTTLADGTISGTTTYSAASSSSYNTPANWSGGVAPSGTSAPATFSSSAGGSQTVTLDSAITLGTLSFSGSTNYTLAPAGASANAVTLSNGAFGPASLLVSGSNPTITAPVVAPGATQVIVAAGSTLSVKTLQAGGMLTVAGSGTVAVTDKLSGSGAAGTLSIADGATVRLSAPGTTTGHRVALEGLSISVGGTATSKGTLAVTGVGDPHTANSNVVRMTGLTIANNGAPLGSRTYYGFLDLGASDAVISPGAANYSTTLVSALDMVRSWSHAGADGRPGTVGLGSTYARYTNTFTTLAVVGNNLSGNLFMTSFDGLGVGLTDVLLKYTYVGDLDLDGDVDAGDFARLSQGLAGGGTGWSYGDVNYDGVINQFDMIAMIEAFRGQGASLGDLPSNVSAPVVPEPAAAGGIIFAATALLSRRRRAAAAG